MNETIEMMSGRKTREFPAIQMEALPKLIELFGSAGAARKIGYSDSGLSKLITEADGNGGMVRQTPELAARYVLSQIDREVGPQIHLVALTPETQRKLGPVLEAFGVSTTRIEALEQS